MARYRDPNAPVGRVVFGGEAFIDGVTADIKIGPETRALFKSAGITELANEAPEPVEPSTKAEKPTRRK